MASTLQQQLDDLREAYRSGVLTCQYEGKSTTFRSLAEMATIIAGLERELDPRPVRQAVIRTHKGW